MSSRRRLSRSSKKLNVDLPSRKLVLSKSSRDLHSPRTNVPKSIRTQKQLRVAKVSQAERPVILQIENQTIKTKFEQYPLKRQYEAFRSEMELEGRDVMVISKIEEFSEQYNKGYDEVYSKATSVSWIIVSNAVNCEFIEKEFNQNYQPIRFRFLRSLTAVINHFNFVKKSQETYVSLNWFSRILNFQEYFNNFACILEVDKTSKQKLQRESRELWLLSENQMNIIKNTSSTVYFLEFEEINNTSIKVVENNEDDFLYVITKDHEQILSTLAIQNLEKAITINQIKSNLSLSLHPRYCSKILEMDKIDEEIVYCLIDFPSKIVKELKKYLTFVVSFSENVDYRHISLFHIYYGNQNKDDFFGFYYRKDEKVQNQAYRIKNYCEAMKKIGKAFITAQFDRENPVFLGYNINNDQLQRQIEWYTKMTIIQLENLTDVHLYHQKQILLLGYFEQQEKLYLEKINSIYLIDLKDCDENNLIIHNQVLQALDKMTKRQDSLIYLTTSPKVLSFNVDIQEFSSNPIYVNKSLLEFRYTLSNIEQNYQHMIIMQMNDYSEEKEQKILETQALKHVTIEVYLKYGKEFIFRSKSDKYHFLKREELINKIQQLSIQNRKSYILNKRDYSTFGSQRDFDYDQRITSEVTHYPQFECNCLSTPNLKESKQKELLILIPKTLPFHSLVNRSSQPYYLLVYSSIQQTTFLTKYLQSYQYASIIVGESENVRNFDNVNASNFQYKHCRQLGEKQVRDEIDRVVERFGLTKKTGSICKPGKKSQFLVLYDQKDSKQAKIISLMKTIFKTSKIIALSKQQYKEIKLKYSTIDKIQIFELGYPQISSAKRVKNVIDLFKVYMSPFSGCSQFTANDLQFSVRQVFIRQFLERLKKDKVKGKLHELSLSRSLSPRTKSVIGKQNISQAGLTILESKNANKDSRRQTFEMATDLLQKILLHLKKGNNILVIITDKEYDIFESFIKVNPPGLIWIIVTNSIKRTIIKSSSLTFCLTEHLQSTISQISSTFRKFRNRDFELKESEDPFLDKTTISVSVYERWSQYLEALLPNCQELSLIRQFDSAYVTLQNLNGALLFGKKSKFQKVLDLFHYKTIKKQEQKGSSFEIETVIIVVQQRNRQFLEHCLKILKERNCILVTYQVLPHLVLYAQVGKTLMIFEEKDKLRLPSSLILHPSDTPFDFSSKLASFLQSLRKSA